MVVDAGNNLVGILGARDVQFVRDRSRPVESVMLPLDRLVVGKPDIDTAQAGAIFSEQRIDKQADEVRRVKRAENFVIEEPYACSPQATLAEAVERMHEYEVGTLMVVDAGNKLVGMLGARDVQFVRDRSRPVESVMRPLDRLVVGKPDIDKAEASGIFAEQRIDKLPLVDSGGRLVGLITARDLLRISENPSAAKDRRGRLLVGAAIGVMGDYMERTAALIEQDVDALVIDIAHGHSDQVI